MMKLVADIDIPFLEGVFEPHFTSVVYKKGIEISHQDIVDADVIIVRTRTICNIKLLSNSKVKVIATATIGTDHIDLDYCKKNGIEVISAPGCNGGGVLQWVQAVIFNQLEKIGRSPKNIVLGIVGAGNIGKLVVETGKSLGMHILVNDPPREREEGSKNFTNLKTIAKESDIITFHVPFTKLGPDVTFHIANGDLFDLMKPKTLILNSSRGGVIDEQALLNAIVKSDLAVALDVWEDEPNISKKMLVATSIATPHIAGYSLEGKVNATVMVVNAVSKFFNLGLDNWKPKPNPCEQKVKVDISNLLNSNSLDFNKLYKNIYPIMNDDRILRDAPNQFEAMRNSYALRRENIGFEIINCRDKETKNLLEGLGFGVST